MSKTICSSLHAINIGPSDAFIYNVVIQSVSHKGESSFKFFVNDPAKNESTLNFKHIAFEKNSAFRNAVKKAHTGSKGFGVIDSVIVFDGSCRLVSNRELTTLNYTIDRDDIMDSMTIFRRNDVLIELQFVEKYRLDDLSSFFDSERAAESNTRLNIMEMITSAYALESGLYMQLNSSRGMVSKTACSREESNTGPGRELVPGCTKRIMTYTHGKEMALCVTIDPSKNVYYTTGNLAEIVNNDLLRGRRASVREVISAFQANTILGVLVKLTHRTNGDCIAARKFSKDAISDMKVEIKGKSTSLIDFYKEKHNVHIKYPHFPCIEVKTVSKDRTTKEKVEKLIYYPLEVCEIIGGQQVPVPKMDPTSAKCQQMVNTAGPVKRKYDSYVQMVNLGLTTCTANKYLAGFELSVSDIKLTHVADDVPKPKMGMAGSCIEIFKGRHDGNKKNDRYFKCAQIKNIYFFVSRDCRDSRKINEFVSAYTRTCERMGIRIESNRGVIETDTTDDRRLFEDLRSIKNDADAFVILIDPKRNASHNSLKIFEQENDIITQHITFEKALVAPTQSDTLRNIINKTNAKNGGICFDVSLSSGHLRDYDLKERKTLYIGLDLNTSVSALVKGSNETNSVGWAANVSANACQFIGDFFYQDRNKSLPYLIDYDGLRTVMKEILVHWEKNCSGVIPKKIVVFRSGLNGFEINEAIKNEVPVIEEISDLVKEQFKTTESINITVVHVNKGSAVRFFDKEESSVPKNVEVGTFVSDKVSHTGKISFFAKTNASCMGTAKLPLYSIVFDQNNMDVEALEQIVYMLAYCHDIIPGGVALPSCTYQAIELSKRAKNNSEKLKELNRFVVEADGFVKLSLESNYTNNPKLRELRYNA
uniref:Piwi domain-containing protein n=1 Tax=Rhabditophanes sp. KR3021 TaxID=114890 RepID=A0AC35UGV2_9BILA